MHTIKSGGKIKIRYLIFCLIIALIFNCIACNSDNSANTRGQISSAISDSIAETSSTEEILSVNAILVLPENPIPGEPFRILAAGGKNVRKAKIIVSGKSENLESIKSRTSPEDPYWRIDDFNGCPEGAFKASLVSDKEIVNELEFSVSPRKEVLQGGRVWKTRRGWDSEMEALYSAWINALFYGCDEHSSWSALHEVTQNQDKNFLYNYLSLGEDDKNGKNRVIMQPDCADNPFFLRAYFAWKLGLPFGYHLCDRGYLGHSPKTGQWITNETSTSKTNAVLAFNSFLRRVADGVHSGTARTALDNENSDYYPVSLNRNALRPGTVYADPYGHTLIITGWLRQTKDHPGLLLSVDAQPDGTVGIKRFWKGNFLFNTSGVVGEPGFKAFRPITIEKGVPYLIRNNDLTDEAGFESFSLEQREMESEVFYHSLERLINPRPLDPETALEDQIMALYEQLMVRTTSVANGEAYFKSNPGTVIPMPSSAAGIFQAGGQWENFSTPNRDLRLLIAIDAVIGFPDLVASSPEDFDLSGLVSPEQIRKKLRSFLDRKVSELSISYVRTDGSTQKLTVGEILERRESFEMAYNPNDGIEIRWGAPENSEERSTCRRHAPANQLEKMRSVRSWFSKRLHPPT